MAIWENRLDYVSSRTQLSLFYQRHHIFLPIYILSSRWALIYCNVSEGNIVFLDPFRNSTEPALLPNVKTTAKLLSQLTLSPIDFTICASGFQRSLISKSEDSGPVICGYMQHIKAGTEPSHIDLRSIRKEIFLISRKLRNANEVPDEIKHSSIPASATLPIRILQAQATLESIMNLGVEEALECFENTIFSSRFKGPRSPFIGIKLHDDAHNLPNLYNKHPKRAFEIITKDNNSDCQPSTEDIEKHFSSRATVPITSPLVDSLPVVRGPSFSFRPITTTDIKAILKKSNDSAPGANNITYRDLQYCDPHCIIMEFLLNKILTTQTIPVSWSQYDTLLIPKPMKQGHYNLVSSWRPIALLDCLYKVLTSALCSQLHRWTIANNLLHPQQKSLGPFNGCSEHNFTLQAIIDKYQNQIESPLHCLLLDIEEAFCSISIQAINKLLLRMGVTQSVCDLVSKLYNGCSTSFICGNTRTDPVPICVGVRQGCPLSMLLFNIGINPALLQLDDCESIGVSIGDHHISSLAYADDVVVISSDKSALQAAANIATRAISIMNMRFRPDKCSVFSLPKPTNKEIFINNTPIHNMTAEETCIYLGGVLSGVVRQTPESLFTEVVRDLSAVVKSSLFPWQKLQAYWIFIHSRLIYAFRIFHIPIDSLHGSAASLENLIRGFLKEILGVLPSSSNSYIYTPRSLGGVGMTSILDEYLVQSLSQAFCMLGGSDADTMSIAMTFLQRASSGKYKNTLISKQRALDWLNKGDAHCASDSWWDKIRYSVERLSSLYQIKARMLTNEHGICLALSYNNTSILITRKDKKKVAKIIRNLVGDSWSLKWNIQCSAGRFAGMLRQSPLTARLTYSGCVSVSEWFFLHKFHTYSLPVRSWPGAKKNPDKTCRRCKSQDETVAHVFVICKFSSIFWSYRHNSIVSFLAAQIRLNIECELYINSECPFVSSRLRPDLQIKITSKRRILLVDVKCPYETEKNVDQSDKANVSHYTDLAKEIKQQWVGWTVVCGTVAVGVPGSWSKCSSDILKSVGLKEPTIKFISKNCILSNIKWTLAQWNYHRDCSPPDLRLLYNTLRNPKDHSETFDLPGDILFPKEPNPFRNVNF